LQIRENAEFKFSRSEACRCSCYAYPVRDIDEQEARNEVKQYSWNAFRKWRPFETSAAGFL